MQHDRAGRPDLRGATLIELIVAVSIVAILAAISIPVFSMYIKESRMSEAATNIQGILESEQAYFIRFQRYTMPLNECPGGDPHDNTVPWAPCDGNWLQLGWEPDSFLFFRYRVWTHNDGAGDLNVLPTTIPNSTQFGVNWVAERFNAVPVQPWCAVQARGDTDGDNNDVFFRGNSYNHKVYRNPNKHHHGSDEH